jgi:hypothetical protein
VICCAATWNSYQGKFLEYKEKKINKRVPLVLTYHPSLEKISGIVRHHWKEIEKKVKRWPSCSLNHPL